MVKGCDADMVDILLATYNGEKHVAQLIESILGQSHTELRLLVSDDCSIDGTLEIVNGFALSDKRIEIISSGIRFGSAKSNFLSMLERSTSKYIAFADQDDVWEKDKISLLLSEIKRVEQGGDSVMPALVFSDLSVVNGDLRPLARSYFQYMKINPHRTRVSQLLVQNVVTGCACLLNRELLNAFDRSKINSEKIVMHDYALAEFAALCGRISYLDIPLVKYRQHGANSVGATKYSVGKWAIRRIENEKGIKSSVRQADSILRCCAIECDPGIAAVFERYASILEQGKLSRVFILFKFGFWKSTLSRRAGQILYLLTMPKEERCEN